MKGMAFKLLMAKYAPIEKNKALVKYYKEFYLII